MAENIASKLTADEIKRVDASMKSLGWGGVQHITEFRAEMFKHSCGKLFRFIYISGMEEPDIVARDGDVVYVGMPRAMPKE